MSDYETIARQIQFLLDCANDREPLMYITEDRQRRAILTRLSRSEPYKRGDHYEPTYRLVLVDAWSGFQLQDAAAAKVQTASAFSLFDQQTYYWSGTARWGFAQWG